jgi:signal transduction histidine kinase
VAGAALVVGVALGGAWLAARAAPQPGIVTQVDQLGDRIAIVQIQGAGASAAADAARASTVRWTLVALGVALVPLLGLGWLVAGRLAPAVAGRDVDDDDGADTAAVLSGEAEQLRAQRDRDRRHLQEVVHELRTPLAVAATNLDLAVTSPALDAEVSGHLAAARRGVERLARTVDDLATHGRLSVGDDGAVDLAVEVRALAHEHGGLADARGLTLQVEGPERLVVAADRAAVHTAVGNLLANAVRLAPSGSIVRLATGTWDEWAWVAVRDEGPGLPDVDHERAFRRYWRGRYDLDRETGGTGGTGEAGAYGLGLTICRQVTEAQGGHVTVRSAVGIGSTFVVWLPRSADARTDAVVAADGIHHRVDPLPGRSVAIPRATPPQPSSPQSPATPPQPFRSGTGRPERQFRDQNDVEDGADASAPADGEQVGLSHRTS